MMTDNMISYADFHILSEFSMINSFRGVFGKKIIKDFKRLYIINS